MRSARHLHSLTGDDNLCMAGGVALNCTAIGRLLRECPFKNIWIQPADGDAGGSVGAALMVYHRALGKERETCRGRGKMNGAYLGPDYLVLNAFLLQKSAQPDYMNRSENRRT